MRQNDKAHFDTFGFLFKRQLYTAEEMETIGQAAEQVWTGELGRAPACDEDMHVAPFVERNETLLSLADDERIYDTISSLLGEDFIWSGSEGNRGFAKERPVHHWHTDRPGETELEYTRIKIMIYLDPTVKDLGAIRVIPGSHRMPLHEALQPFQKRHVERTPDFFGMDGADVPCYPVESRPGDVLFFNQSLFHSVYGKTGSRRYIALKYAERPRCDAQLSSLKKWSDYALHPHEGILACDRPAIRKMIEDIDQLREKAEEISVA
jgi:ectoine hydroxylase-related dioxygenase (phytanoyl-CoA dioxygenase family)